MTAMLKSSEYEFSPHALDRILDMALDADEVVAAMRNYPIKSPEGVRWIGSRITVFGKWDPRIQKTVITTVVWKTDELWREDLSARPCEGRELRI